MSLRIGGRLIPDWVAGLLYIVALAVVAALPLQAFADDVTDTCKNVGYSALLARAMALSEIDKDKTLATLHQLVTTNEEGTRVLERIVDGAYTYALLPRDYALTAYQACLLSSKQPASLRKF